VKLESDVLIMFDGLALSSASVHDVWMMLTLGSAP